MADAAASKKRKKELGIDEKVPLGVHLSELRYRLIICFSALTITSTAAFWVAPMVWDHLALPIGSMYFYGPADAFMVQMKLAVLLGVLTAAPVLIWQLWLFVKPGLYEHERVYVGPLTGISVFLFYGGIAFGLLILPIALKVMIGFKTDIMEPAISLSSFVSFTTILLLCFGVVFQMPIVLLFLTRFGIVRVETLRRYRKIAIVVNLIIAAALPTVDVVSLLMEFFPLVILYEIGILISSFYMKNIRKSKKINLAESEINQKKENIK